MSGALVLSLTYLACEVLCHEYVPCCEVAVNEALTREILHPGCYFTGKPEEHGL